MTQTELLGTGDRKPSFADWLQMIFRVFVVVGMPLGVGGVGYAIDIGREALNEFNALRENVAEIRTGLLVGLQPRVSRVEAELSALHLEMKNQRVSEFTTKDADRMETTIRKETQIAEQALRRELDLLHAAIESLKQDRSNQ